MQGYLVLENGEIFKGEKIGYDKEVICELAFDTSMVGHVEVFADAKFEGKGLCMTYPLIGNYGSISEEDISKDLSVKAIFIHEMDISKDYITEINLNNLLIKNEIPGLEKINTRELARIIRENGIIKGMIINNIENIEDIVKRIKEGK